MSTMTREWSADVLSQNDAFDMWSFEGLIVNVVGFPISILFAFHLGFVETLRCCMPTREDNSWRVYGLHVLSLPIRLAVAIVLIAAVLPFSIVNLLLIMPLKCLLNASKCTANRDNSFGTEASHNAASENHASPSCYPSACTWSPLVFSKEQENRAKIHGCKHLLQLICCTVVVGNRPYTACPVCCSPKRTFSPALMYHV